MDLDMGMGSHITQLQDLTARHRANRKVFGFGREGVGKPDFR